VHQVFIEFKNACDSIRKEVLYNILIQISIAIKVTRPIKVRLNETYSRVRIGKHLSDMLLIRNGLKQGDALSPVLSTFP